MGRAIEEGLPVSFKTYKLLGPPRSRDYRLTPTSPARRDRREGSLNRTAPVVLGVKLLD